MTNKMDWVSEREKQLAESKGGEYFQIVEGQNKFVLLTHCAPFDQVFDQTTKKYRVAEEGDTNVSVKGICFVLQDDKIKLARLPYSVVKQIKALQDDPEWNLEFPFLHTLTLNAKNAGTKEVEYNITPSPKKIELSNEVLEELAKKPSPEEMVEKLKNSSSGKQTAPAYEYPDIDPGDVPF